MLSIENRAAVVDALERRDPAVIDALVEHAIRRIITPVVMEQELVELASAVDLRLEG